MIVQPLRIVWTKHAIERAIKRFGGSPSIKIPNGLIIAVGINTAIGGRFRVRVGNVIYICARDVQSCVIITVADDRTKRGGRRKRKRR